MRLPITLLAATLLTALPALAPTPAHACGGTFCDLPPPNQPPMPVDQSGENVLFVVENGRVEAHVQIQYTGNPERFAWVVPMPKKPKITAGSQRLFENLLQSTVPTFQVQGAFASNCGNSRFSDGGGVGCGATSESTADEAAFAPGRANGAAGGSGQPSGPEVIGRASVGSYETVTLSGGSADELLTWLNENNYLVPDGTSKFLADYLEQQFVFVAIKLTAGAGLNEIHPLTFSYDGDEPCVPLKLTAVAATEDMGVRTFFLGSERFAPKNYKHVVVNDLRFDWTAATGRVSNNMGPALPGQQPAARQINYNEVISEAVDSPLTNGRAFVTEYAGASSIVPGTGIADTRWNSTPFKTATASQALNLLRSQGLLECTGSSASSTCTSPSPLLFPLLAQTLPVPLGANPANYYACITCFSEGEPESWSGEYFALELEERIFGPARHAEDILRKNPYLTRMFTTISPAEMVEDPEFIRTPRADVGLGRTASQQLQCDGSTAMIVGTDEVYLQNDTTRWPDLPPAMPFALRVEEYKSDGSVIVLRDNSKDIQAELAAFNKARSWPPEPEFTTQDDTDNTCAMGFGPVRGRTTMGAFLGLAGVALVVRRLRRTRA
jgi:hypothetical protein